MTIEEANNLSVNKAAKQVMEERKMEDAEESLHLLNLLAAKFDPEEASAPPNLELMVCKMLSMSERSKMEMCRRLAEQYPAMEDAVEMAEEIADWGMDEDALYPLIKNCPIF